MLKERSRMMNILIIYDSAYGNTARIAEAMASAVPAQHRVIAKQVNQAGTADASDTDILVVGSPTQGGMPTRPVQQYIDELPPHILSGKAVAAFDTRFSRHGHGWWLGLLTRLVGFASPRITSKLKAKGGMLVLPPAGFIVGSKEGPLEKYEPRRAADWMKKLLANAPAASRQV